MPLSYICKYRGHSSVNRTNRFQTDGPIEWRIQALTHTHTSFSVLKFTLVVVVVAAAGGHENSSRCQEQNHFDFSLRWPLQTSDDVWTLNLRFPQRKAVSQQGMAAISRPQHKEGVDWGNEVAGPGAPDELALQSLDKSLDWHRRHLGALKSLMSRMCHIGLSLSLLFSDMIKKFIIVV